MKNSILTFLIVIGLGTSIFSMSQMDTTTIVITDNTLESVYYHQENFTEPTRLIFPNLTTVEGYVYFYENPNLISVDFPNLNYTGEYVFFNGNQVLESINAPALETIHEHLYVEGNPSLIELNVCALSYILPYQNQFDPFLPSPPYYYITNNTSAVDTEPFCFSQGPPENFTLSNSTIAENAEPGTVVGILSAEGNYAVNDFTYFFSIYDNWDEYFFVEGDTLKSNLTFDFETQNEYEIVLSVFNQMGETITQTFTISIEDVVDEGIQTIEILDGTLASVYYHQENFTEPTRLVFPNLTTVEGYVYFYENPNLISVDFPNLNYTGEYVFFNSNQVLESINAPALETIHESLYVEGNPSLTELNVCALSYILPYQNQFDPLYLSSPPYYYITNNTDAVDTEPFCFSQGPPENLSLSNSMITENAEPETIIGILSAEGNYPVNDFTYFLSEFDNFENNQHFFIEGDTLKSNSTFDFEVQNEYEITVSVFNQMGETTTQNFTISIEDVDSEGMQTIEILDDTLASIYYHQENFTSPTRLSFPNLTTVLGYTYFYENPNLISVDLPNLNYVGSYVFFSGNQVLESIDAPVIDTIHEYLYVEGHPVLTELNICSLSHILPSDEYYDPELGQDTYYYIENNPLLELATACLDTTILEFRTVDELTPAALTLVGNFESQTSDPIEYSMLIGEQEVTETDEFIIIEDELFLKKEISEYTEESYPLSIVALRMDTTPNTTLNERIELPIEVSLPDILPIKLTNFEAKIENKTALLTWETATETNNKGFDIEKSKDGTNWEKIAWQDGQGNSSISHSYRYIDETPFFGVSYYRLRQVDFDGTFSYSKVVNVRFEEEADFSLYPNPAKDILSISGIKAGQNRQIIVYDQSGKTVFQTIQTSNELNVSALIPGLYVMTVTTENDVFYGKFVVH